MKIGDRVKKGPMWKYKIATGTVIKITKDYTVVQWDDINGHWHYTDSQSKALVKIESD
ncbi:hypothetical protein OAA09_00900 [bacterium]|nr:hypothetical protein [bacterium]